MRDWLIGLKAFNSKLVRLKATNGTIKTNADVISAFNSKLVRLKVARRYPPQIVNLGFQFQTGAIKSDGHPSNRAYPLPPFNSKLVRLKVPSPSWWTKTMTTFNSKLVRLKAWISLLRKSTVTFQFHTGAIKSETDELRACNPLESFNSKLVRLKEC